MKVPTPVRILAIAIGAIVALVVLVLGLALAFMPRDFIDRQARKLATRIPDTAVHWDRMTPGWKGLAIGVKLEGLTIRTPATGDPKTDLRAKEVFVRMRVIPLLFRRVEVSSANLDSAWIAMYERAQPEAAPESISTPKFQVHVPRVDFTNLTIRTRDPFGSGSDIYGLSGHVDLEGMLDAPTAIDMSITADRVSWKPSEKGAPILLPSPVAFDATLRPESRAKDVLRVTKGTVKLGDLTSGMGGTMQFPRNQKQPGPVVNLIFTGKGQRLSSKDEAFRSLTATMPAEWQGTAGWNIRARGRAPDIVTDGILTMTPFSVSAKGNSFSFGQVRAQWSTRADRTFTARAGGSGSGVVMSLRAEGSAAPGGSSSGVLMVRAPATRLNGLMPQSPVWHSGMIDLSASFELHPPAKPQIRWTVRGQGINGTMQGLARPVQGLQFDIEGTDQTASIRSLRATVGSTTADMTGSLQRRGKLNTGTVNIRMNRLIAEEWAPPAGGKAPAAVAAPHPAQLPIQLGAFDGSVAIGEVHSGKMRLTNVTVPLRFDGTNLTAAPFTGSLGSGSLTGNMIIRSLFTSPSYSLHIDAKRVPVDQLSAGTIPFSSAVTGFMTGVVDLAAKGLPSPQVNDTMQGLLKGSVEDGKLHLSPTILAVASSLGLRQNADVTLKDETHSLRILGRKMVLDKVTGDLDEDKAEMTGTVGLDHTLDLDVLLRLASSRIKESTIVGQIAKYARDTEGRVPVTLKITGLDRAPKVKVNTQALLQAAGKQAVRQIGQNVADQMLRGLVSKKDSARMADSIKRAETPPSAGTPPAKAPGDTTHAQTAPTESTKVDPAKKAREALRRILGK